MRNFATWFHAAALQIGSASKCSFANVSLCVDKCAHWAVAPTVFNIQIWPT